MSLPRLYVSGPITGYPDLNFPAFRSAASQLRAFGYEVVNPIEVVLPCGCNSPKAVCGADEHDWQDFMRADIIEMLQGADAVATLPEDPSRAPSRGMKAEIALARSLGWTVGSVSWWLQRVWFPELRPGQMLPAAVPFAG